MIEKINRHYSMTNPASIYDEEALTSLELSALTARKVNEVVDAQNELEETVNAKINEFNEVIEDVPNTVEKRVDEHFENGDFDAVFRNYYEPLSERIDFILSGVTEDGEVLDARVTADGRSYMTLGKMLRSELGRMGGQINNILRYKTEELSRENIVALSGALHTEVSDGTVTTDSVAGETAKMGIARIPVNAGEVYLVTAYYGFSTPMAAVSSSTGLGSNVVDTYNYQNSPNKMTKEKFTTPIIIPDTGRYLFVSWANENMNYQECVDNITVKKVVGYEVNNEGLEAYINNLLQPMNSLQPIYEPIVGLGDCESGVLQLKDNGVVKISVSDDLDPKYHVWYNPLNAGEHIRFKGEANYANVIYAFVDEAGFAIDYKKATTGSDMCTENIDTIVPMGVSGVWVAGYYDGAGVAEKVVGYTETDKKWHHLKWACLGDSITEHNTRSLKNYDQYISEKTGIKVQNLGVSGAGYMAETENGNCMWQLAEQIEEDTDVITIFAGVNDNSYMTNGMGEVGVDDNSLLNNVWAAYDAARAVAPNAKIGIISPPPVKAQTPMKPDCNFSRFSDKLAELCRYHGIPYLDMYRLSFGTLRPDEGKSKSRYYSREDGLNLVHPDENGHKVMSSFIHKFLDELIGTY